MPAKRIPDNVIQEIRSRTPVLDVVSEHVQMRASGNVHKGLCPFHDERTPSFTANPGTNTWRCFGCSKGGDVIDFISEIEGVDFRMAVAILAERLGINAEAVDAGEEEQQQGSRTRLIQANDAASAFFSDLLLNSPEAGLARDLLTGRGFDVAESVSRFGCGYAPQAGGALVSHLLSRKFSMDEIVGAGLASQGKSSARAYDRFRGRLLWAIHNPFGKTVGFGARRLSEKDPIEAKFINTAETPVYKKSHVLYGLDIARRSMSKERRVLVVEGYTDVMACHLAGIDYAVAPCGTAFGADQLSLIRRIIGEDGEVISGFDDDEAGRKAAMGFYDSARTSMKRLTVLPASGGKDPDEYRQAHGDEGLSALVNDRVPLIQFVIRSTIRSRPLGTPEDRSVALDAVVPLLNHVKDRLIRAEYAAQVGKMLNFPTSDILARADRASSRDKQGDATHEVSPSVIPQGAGAGWVERELLRVFTQDRHAAQECLDDARWYLTIPASQQVADALESALNSESVAQWPLRVAECAGEGARGLVHILTAEGLPVPTEQASTYARELIHRLVAEAEAKTVSDLREQLSATTDPEQRRALLARIIEATKHGVG